MKERLETEAQTASSSSRELQHMTIGSDGRRPATPSRSTSVSCNQNSPLFSLKLINLVTMTKNLEKVTILN